MVHACRSFVYLEYKAYYRVPPEKLPKELSVPVPEDDYIVLIGKARVVREGDDISVITYGSQVIRAVEAAQLVGKEDYISIEVVDLRTVVPYDLDCVRRSVQKKPPARW